MSFPMKHAITDVHTILRLTGTQMTPALLRSFLNDIIGAVLHMQDCEP